MAQTALTIVGYAVGSYFGYPQLGAAVGAYVGGQYEISQQKFTGARLQDLKVPNFEYGASIPRIYGACRVPGIPIWMSDKREISTTTGGKGGAEPEVESFTYEVDVLYLVSEGEIDAVPRVWRNGDLVFTAHVDSDEQSLGASATSGAWGDMIVYTGAADQLPDPVYEAAVGVGAAPAYRGRGTVMLRSLQLGPSGQIPLFTFEVLTKATAVTQCVEAEARPPIFFGPRLEENDPVFPGDPVWTGFNGVYEIIVPQQGLTFRHILQAQRGVQGCRRYFEIRITDLRLPGGTSSANTPEFWVIRAGTGYSGDEGLGIIGVPLTGGAIGVTRNGSICDGTGTAVGAFTEPPATAGGPGWGLGTYVWSVVLDCDTSKLWVGYDNTWWGGVPNSHPSIASSGWDASAVLPPGSTDLRFEFTAQGSQFHLQVETRTDRAGFIRDVPEGCVPWSSDAADATIYTPGLVYLDDIVAALCRDAGLTDSEIDVTALAGIEVDGVPITQASAPRATLETLALVYFFEAVESDKLYFRRRGGASVATIAYGECGAAADGARDDESALRMERGNDLEIPKVWSLQYINPNDDYQAGTVASDRLVTESIDVRPVQAPIVMNEAKAQGVVDAAVLDARVSSTTFGPRIASRRPELEPTDVVLLEDDDGSMYRARIVRDTFEAGVRQLECVLDDASVLTSTGITDTSAEPSYQVRKFSRSEWLVLDIPLLRDADDRPGPYVMVRPEGDRWPGAVVYSGELEETVTTQQGIVATRGVWGVSTTVMPAYSGAPGTFDEISSVTVDVRNGALSSYTRDQILAGLAPGYMIGAEAIFARTATLVAPGVYTLTGLLRGRRGTEWAMADHAIGETVALLSLDGGMLKTTQDLTTIGVPWWYRAITQTRTSEDADPLPATDTGVVLRPFAPVDIRAEEEASGATVITWKRRTRLACIFTGPQGIRVPLGEAEERYVVRVYTTAPETLVRTYSVSAATATYTREEQVADGVAYGTPLRVDVAQVSESVGEGYVGSAHVIGSARSLAQVTRLILGGTFQAGVLIRAVIGGVTFNYTTSAPDATLAGVASGLAALIDAHAVYSATADDASVLVSGALATPFSVIFSIPVGDNATSTALVQEAAAESVGLPYLAYLLVGNSVNGVTEPIPSGTQFSVRVQKPVGVTIGQFSYTTAQQMSKATMFGFLVDAFHAQTSLGPQGYSAGQTFLNGFAVGTFLGPTGVLGVHLEASATAPFTLAASLAQPPAPEIPADQPQIVTASFTGIPITGATYRVTLGGVSYDYEAGSGSSMSEVVTELTADIEASAPYSATAVITSPAAAYIEIEGAPLVGFTYSTTIIVSTITTSTQTVQAAV